MRLVVPVDRHAGWCLAYASEQPDPLRTARPAEDGDPAGGGTSDVTKDLHELRLTVDLLGCGGSRHAHAVQRLRGNGMDASTAQRVIDFYWGRRWL